MTTPISRRGFLGTAPGALGVAAFLGFQSIDEAAALASPKAKPSGGNVPASFPSHDPDVAQEIVRVSHFDFDKVRKMVTARPALAKASWDWGFGDWETAIGAASHIGRLDIAELLIKHGARPTLFTFAMMGQLEPVKALIAANPGIQRNLGPHGITLLAHAKAGGENAQSVLKYLESLGDADVGEQGTEPIEGETDEIQAVYAYGLRDDERLEVFEKNGKLAIKRTGRVSRDLIRIGPWQYHPQGAPAVSITFQPIYAAMDVMVITDGDFEVVAKRPGAPDPPELP